MPDYGGSVTRRTAWRPDIDWLGFRCDSLSGRDLARGLARSVPTMDRRKPSCAVPGWAWGPASPRRSSRWSEGRGGRPGGIRLGGGAKIEVKRTVCTHCSVGCAIDAVVENGVWVRQEPVFDSPINLGAHCAKGAAVRENGTANTG
jgi:formate dehydrogenase major subunit